MYAIASSVFSTSSRVFAYLCTELSAYLVQTILFGSQLCR